MKQKSIVKFKFLIPYDYNVIDKNRNIKSAKKNYFIFYKIFIKNRNRVLPDLTKCGNPITFKFFSENSEILKLMFRFKRKILYYGIREIYSIVLKNNNRYFSFRLTLSSYKICNRSAILQKKRTGFKAKFVYAAIFRKQSCADPEFYRCFFLNEHSFLKEHLFTVAIMNTDINSHRSGGRIKLSSLILNGLVKYTSF